MGKGPDIPQAAVDAQVNLEKTMGDLATQYASTALPLINKSADYWSQILAGGPQAQAAVAPYAEKISSAYTGARNNITNLMPAGGERNLALAQLPGQQAGQLASLYAGAQPTAAGALGSLGTGQASSGAQIGGVGANAGASTLNLAGQQAQAKGATLGGLGSGAGSLLGGIFAGK